MGLKEKIVCDENLLLTTLNLENIRLSALVDFPFLTLSGKSVNFMTSIF